MGLADGDALAVAVAVALAVARGLADADALPGALAVPENKPVDEGDTDAPLAVGVFDPPLVQAVIPKDKTINTTTLAVRMPTQCLFPDLVNGNLHNRLREPNTRGKAQE